MMVPHWLVIYDVKDPRRLRYIAKAMEQYAIRVQKSVFEMDATEANVSELRTKVKALMEDEDFVVYFKICETDWQKRQKFGVGAKMTGEDKLFYIL